MYGDLCRARNKLKNKHNYLYPIGSYKRGYSPWDFGLFPVREHLTRVQKVLEWNVSSVNRTISALKHLQQIATDKFRALWASNPSLAEPTPENKTLKKNIENCLATLENKAICSLHSHDNTMAIRLLAGRKLWRNNSLGRIEDNTHFGFNEFQNHGQVCKLGGQNEEAKRHEIKDSFQYETSENPINSYSKFPEGWNKINTNGANRKCCQDPNDVIMFCGSSMEKEAGDGELADRKGKTDGFPSYLPGTDLPSERNGHVREKRCTDDYHQSFAGQTSSVEEFDLAVSSDASSHEFHSPLNVVRVKIPAIGVREEDGSLIPVDQDERISDGAYDQVSGELPGVDLFPENPDPNNRIVYNTRPKGASACHAHLFVCSDAFLSKKDMLQFGERPTDSISVKDFNVNAVCNKTHSWHDMKAEEAEAESGEGRKPVTAMDGDTGAAEGAKQSEPETQTAKRAPIWNEVCRSFRKRWSSMLRCNESFLDGGSTSTTLSVCGLVGACAVMLFVTGNTLSFVGLLVDVSLHAAMLSLVVTIVVAMFEANGMTCYLLQGCQSFLQIFRYFIKECDSISQTHAVQQNSDSNDVCYIDKADDNNMSQEGAAAAPMRHKHQPHPQTSDAHVKDPDEEMPETRRQVNPKTKSATKWKSCRHRKDCEVGTMTDSSTTGSSSLSVSGSRTTLFSFAATMTDTVPTDIVSTQTDPIQDGENTAVNYLSMEDVGPAGMTNGPDEAVVKKSACVQVNIDVKAIQEQAKKVQQRHHQTLRRFQRKFLVVRRHFQKDASDLKCCHQKRGDILTKLQLALPALQREKNRLIAEKFMVERQFLDQKKKNQELVGRITKLNQQFQVIGQSQQSVLPVQRSQQSLNVLSASYGQQQLFKGGGQGDMQQQQQLPPKSGAVTVTTPQSATQITLASQHQIPPSIPNKWMTHIQQFQQQQQQQHHLVPSPQQQTKPHHQARLPIFKLLQNSTKNTDEFKRQQQIQQQQQLFPPASSVDRSNSHNVHCRPVSSMPSFQQGDTILSSQSDPLAISSTIGQRNDDNDK